MVLGMHWYAKATHPTPAGRVYQLCIPMHSNHLDLGKGAGVRRSERRQAEPVAAARAVSLPGYRFPATRVVGIRFS